MKLLCLFKANVQMKQCCKPDVSFYSERKSETDRERKHFCSKKSHFFSKIYLLGFESNVQCWSVEEKFDA